MLDSRLKLHFLQESVSRCYWGSDEYKAYKTLNKTVLKRPLKHAFCRKLAKFPAAVLCWFIKRDYVLILWWSTM